MEPKKETKPLFMIDNVAEDILKSTNRELCKQHMINNRSRFTEALRVEMEKIIHKDYVSFDKADKKEYFPVYEEEDGVEFRDSVKHEREKQNLLAFYPILTLLTLVPRNMH